MYQPESYKRSYKAQPRSVDVDPFQALYAEPLGDQFWRTSVNGYEENGSGESTVPWYQCRDSPVPPSGQRLSNASISESSGYLSLHCNEPAGGHVGASSPAGDLSPPVTREASSSSGSFCSQRTCSPNGTDQANKKATSTLPREAKRSKSFNDASRNGQRVRRRQNNGWRLSDHDLCASSGCTEQAILQELSVEIVQLMEGGALLPSLKARGLVGQEDEEFLFDSCCSRRQQNQFLLHLVSQQGGPGFEKFIDALSDDQDHWSHHYLANMLREAYHKGAADSNSALCYPEEDEGDMTGGGGEDGGEDWLAMNSILPGPVGEEQPGEESTHTWPKRHAVHRDLYNPYSSLTTRCHVREGYCGGVATGRGEVRGVAVYGPRPAEERLQRKKIQWLQQRIILKHCSEGLDLSSSTRWGEHRQVLYSGILQKGGQPRFVVLFTDLLLILKAKGKTKGKNQMLLDWFSDHEFTTKEPFLLHQLTVKKKAQKEKPTTFCLQYKRNVDVLDIILQACSVEAKTIWIEQLNAAIEKCTSAQAQLVHLAPQAVTVDGSGRSNSNLTVDVKGAVNLFPVPCSPVYCEVRVGGVAYCTPSVKGMASPRWNCPIGFDECFDDDNLQVTVRSENSFSPDTTLGTAQIQLDTLLRDGHHLKGPFSMSLGGGGGAGSIILGLKVGLATLM